MQKLKLFFILVFLAIGFLPLSAQEKENRYLVGVCDWMILKRQKIGEFSLAKQLGCDGIEMDMGSLGNNQEFDNKMRDSSMVKLFTFTADSCGIKIGAVAMSGFYGQSFVKRENYLSLIEDCLSTMEKVESDVAFLPLGGCGAWQDTLEVKKELIFRLHKVGEMALSKGKVIGIDSPLDALGNIEFLREINSDGIKIFYKFQTAIENGKDIAQEIRLLGKDNICAIHASNTDGYLLKNDKAINLEEIKASLDDIGWSGWLFVERSRDINDVHDIMGNYGENVKYLKEVFQ